VVKTFSLVFWVVTLCSLVGGYQLIFRMNKSTVTWYCNPEGHIQLQFHIQVKGKMQHLACKGSDSD
jgi:hypothetical protein